MQSRVSKCSEMVQKIIAGAWLASFTQKFGVILIAALGLERNLSLSQIGNGLFHIPLKHGAWFAI